MMEISGETHLSARKVKSIQQMKQIVKTYAEDPHEFVFIFDLNEALNQVANTNTFMMGVRGPPKTPYCNGIYILTIEFRKNITGYLRRFAKKIKRIKFLDDYTPVATNLGVKGRVRFSYEEFDHVKTLKDVIDAIFDEIFYKCGLDVYDITGVENQELFRLVHVNPNKFLAYIFEKNLKFIVNDHDNNDNNINTFCKNIIQKDQDSKSQLESESKSERYNDSESSNMINGSQDDNTNDNLNVECPLVYISSHDKDKFDKIGNDIGQLLQQLYDIPLEITKNVLLLYLDKSSFSNLDIRLIEILDIIDNVEKRKQQEQLENKVKSKGKIFVTRGFRHDPTSFVVDIAKSTVADLDRMIQDKIGIPGEQQRLVFVNTNNQSADFGKVSMLRSDRCLCDYDMQIGATIYFVLR